MLRYDELVSGATIYAYVGNNPISNVDPLGLCPTCSQVQQAEANLAKAFDHEAKIADYFAVGSGIATGLSGAGEGVTLGGDTPVTLSFGSVTAFFTGVSFFSGAASASLNAAASGNANALVNFNFTQVEGLLATTAARRIPGVGAFADAIGELTGQAVGLVTQSNEACK